MKTLIRHFKKVNGQSLAEFAVTTAMMATLATTAAPKFSGVGEGAKEKKTLADIDKILKSANNFYNTQVTKAGLVVFREQMIERLIFGWTNILRNGGPPFIGVGKSRIDVKNDSTEWINTVANDGTDWELGYSYGHRAVHVD